MATNSLTVLITGGTSGIGRATAKRLAKLGIHVLAVGRNAKHGDETLAETRASGGKAGFISFDLGNASSARELTKRALELGSGHVDILVNNAGVFPFGQMLRFNEGNRYGVPGLESAGPSAADRSPAAAGRPD